MIFCDDDVTVHVSLHCSSWLYWFFSSHFCNSASAIQQLLSVVLFQCAASTQIFANKCSLFSCFCPKTLPNLKKKKKKPVNNLFIVEFKKKKSLKPRWTFYSVLQFFAWLFFIPLETHFIQYQKINRHQNPSLTSAWGKTKCKCKNVLKILQQTMSTQNDVIVV